jgi:hypothetical protein
MSRSYTYVILWISFSFPPLGSVSQMTHYPPRGIMGTDAAIPDRRIIASCGLEHIVGDAVGKL